MMVLFVILLNKKNARIVNERIYSIKIKIICKNKFQIKIVNKTKKYIIKKI
jgi:hypothetical protein